MYLLALFFYLLLLLSPIFACSVQENPSEEHKLIVLISTPRSLSTVFYRMMEARGDCAALCEPGVDAYTLSYMPEFADAICDPYSAKTFEDTEKKILLALHDNPIVFIKEMGFAAREYLLKNRLREVILHDAYCIFLIRDPHQAMISFYKKFPESFEQLSDWFGYDTLYELYEEIKRQSRHKPLIIVADALVANPRIMFAYIVRFLLMKNNLVGLH